MITIGPKPIDPGLVDAMNSYRSAISVKPGSTTAHVCGCVGPQPGQSLCPCRLRAEADRGRQMVGDGVLINGVEYDLVPRTRPITGTIAK